MVKPLRLLGPIGVDDAAAAAGAACGSPESGALSSSLSVCDAQCLERICCGLSMPPGVLTIMSVVPPLALDISVVLSPLLRVWRALSPTWLPVRPVVVVVVLVEIA